jgi:hypothetical protein
LKPEQSNREHRTASVSERITGEMTTRTLVLANAALEVATGLALIAAPGFGVHLLLGADLSSPGITVGRFTGLALLSMGLACWPNKPEATSQVTWALFTYNLLVAVYLLYVRFGEGYNGPLLWPACVLHSSLTLLQARPAIVRLRLAV